MQNRELQPKQIKLIIIVASSVFLAICAIAIFSYFTTRYNGMVVVENIDSCAIGLPTDRKNTIFRRLYQFVESQNQTNNQPTTSTYSGIIRANSCQSADDTNANGELLSSAASFILDIAELQYSFRVQFSYFKNNKQPDEYVDIGFPLVTCLQPSKAIYPDFNCEDNELILATNDNPIYLEIFSVFPYFGEDYNLTYTFSPDSVTGYSIIITYTPPESVYLDGTYDEFITSRRQMAENFLSNNNIDIDDYSIIERTR